ncbi:hypothetical protein [Phenylobacterium sp.]|uniref:hypothetical protein n=1 Tax=Phenylobacterium sp. TaxID=1871053 RepID=UPI0035AF6CE6
MYRLRVIHEGTSRPTETISVEAAAEVLSAIPALLARHRDCLRIEVLMGDTRLFAVDCDGARLDG